MEKRPTIQSYSSVGAENYEDPQNKNFLYGAVTAEFINSIEVADDVKTVLDIGCGTGFVFDEKFEEMTSRRIHGIGVEPAKGMLDIARKKYREHELFDWREGTFENLPLPDKSVEKITSTLALHWVESLSVAAKEMSRVLRPNGSMDILMIAKDDGANFKRAIVEALKKHLSFKQIMATALLVQRATTKDVHAAFGPHFPGFEIDVTQHKRIVYGTFEEHMKWWTARSTPVIAEVEDVDQFMRDLRTEMESKAESKGIPFDAAFLYIRLKSGRSGR
jgi:ubiquinone/menaquinone biosynthesis C-methylase UbiE